MPAQAYPGQSQQLITSTRLAVELKPTQSICVTSLLTIDVSFMCNKSIRIRMAYLYVRLCGQLRKHLAVDWHPAACLNETWHIDRGQTKWARHQFGGQYINPVRLTIST